MKSYTSQAKNHEITCEVYDFIQKVTLVYKVKNKPHFHGKTTRKMMMITSSDFVVT